MAKYEGVTTGQLYLDTHISHTILHLLYHTILLVFVLPAALPGQSSVQDQRLATMETAHRLYRADSLTEAIAAYETVATAPETGIIYDSLAAYALHRMGACYYYQENLAESTAHYRQALAVRNYIFPAPHNQLAKTHSNMGSDFLKHGMTDSAAVHLYMAADLYALIPAPDTYNYLATLVELVDVANRRDDRQLGYEAALTADKMLATAQDISTRRRATLHYNLAYALRYLTHYDLAEKHAHLALELNRELERATRVANCYNMLHLIAKDRKQPDPAVDWLQKAIGATPPDDLPTKTMYFVNLAQLQLAGGRLTDAKTSVLRAERFEADDYLQDLRLAQLRARIAAAAGDETTAWTYLNATIQKFDPATAYQSEGRTYVDTDSLDTDDLQALTLYLIGRAEFADTTGRTTDAVADYKAYFTLQDRLRAGVSSDASRAYLSDNLRPAYDRGVALCLRHYAETKDEALLWQAFEFAEDARAFTLLVNLARSGETRPRRELELRRRIARLERSATTDNAARTQLAEARLELDRLTQTARRKLPANRDKLDKAALIAYLAQRDATLLEYHLGEAGSYLFQLDGTGKLAVKTLPDITELEDIVTNWRTAIRESAFRRKSLRSAKEQGRLDERFLSLGQVMASSLLPEITGHRLIFVPDGPLHGLPFTALPTGADTAIYGYQNLRYLIDDAAVTYGYSAESLLEIDGAGPVTTGELLAFAPEFASGDERLGSLPYARAEAEGFEKLLGGNMLTAAEANRQNFMARAPAARLLHLSTHGFADYATPEQSFVAFSQSGERLDPEELLYYNDLSAIPLRAELVVLSACQTSLGKPAPGETVLSLASAFTAAGARGTLTTLWNVDDAATRDLMAGFYQRLLAGQSRSVAIREAQTELRNSEDYAHPYYWAAVTLHGADGTVDLVNKWPYAWWGLGGVLLLGGFLWARSRVQRKVYTSVDHQT